MRAQMVLCWPPNSASAFAGIVRSSEEAVHRWLKRYLAKGPKGYAMPRPQVCSSR